MKRISFFYSLLSLFFLAGCTKVPAPVYVPPAPTPTPTLSKLAVPPAPSGFKLAGRLTVPYYGDRCSRFVFSPDGKWLAAAGAGYNGGVLFLWKIGSPQVKRRLQLSPQPSFVFTKALWSPDGKIAAWGNQGFYGTLGVWDCSSGALISSMNTKSQIVYSACYTNDGTLLVAWADIDAVSFVTRRGHLSRIRQGRIQQDVPFKDFFILQLAPRKKKPPLALVWRLVDGQGNTQGPVYQSSICEWVNNHLSKPLIQFEKGTNPVAMELSHDEKHLALGGARLARPASLYLMLDLTTNKIIWRTQMRRVSPAFQLSISADDHWLYDPTSSGSSRYFTFDMRNGNMVSKAPPPTYYSNDGALAVRRLDFRTLSSYNLDVIRMHDPKFGPAPNLPIAYLYRK